MIWVLVLGFIGLLAIGVPVSFALAASSLAALAWEGMPLALVAQRMVASIDSFVLLAVPLFLLAGSLMAHSGIARDIVVLAEKLFGPTRGGLGHANIATSAMMSGMTGSAVADTASTGSALIHPMVERGYTPAFSAAVTAVASTIAVVMPPSVPMIIFAVVTGVSLSKLFIAGILPGLMIAAALMGTVYLRRRGLPAGQPRQRGELGRAFLRAIVPLTLPVVIIGSIRYGIATPTEAAVVAVIYAWLVGQFWYGTIAMRDMRPIILSAATTTGVIMLMISAASLYGLILTRAQIPHALAGGIAMLTSNPTLVLLMIAVVYLAVGAILDLGANIIIMVPVLYPTTLTLGIDPIHFGVITVVALSIGLFTPPVGACLFVASSIARVPILSVARETIPFLIALIVVMVAIIVFPGIATWLPSMM